MALLLNVNTPLVDPLVLGLKITLKVADVPAGKVSGKVIPLMENSAFVLVAPEIVMLASVAFSVPARVPLLPTVTLPKASEAGETLNAPAVAPVPLKGIEKVFFPFREITCSEPVTAPLDSGEKFTENV